MWTIIYCAIEIRLLTYLWTVLFFIQRSSIVSSHLLTIHSEIKADGVNLETIQKRVSEWVGFNVPLGRILVISEVEIQKRGYSNIQHIFKVPTVKNEHRRKTVISGHMSYATNRLVELDVLTQCDGQWTIFVIGSISFLVVEVLSNLGS